LWGHAWPRNGERSSSEFVRNLLKKQADLLIVYTESQAKRIIDSGYKKNVIAAPNALYKKKDMNYQKNVFRDNIIYVGRLVKEKKPIILLKAYLEFCKKIKNNSVTCPKLIFVGDGPERYNLEKYFIDNKSGNEQVIFAGHVAGVDNIRKFYNTSFVSVSPGYVGLSITQSFSFGVPMIISRTENHAPEIEAAIDGLNCSYFETDNIHDLCNKLENHYCNLNGWDEKGNLIVENCKNNYSIEHMASRILSGFRSEE
jgi:glycosyltransferase involved in cell wall biosynthesis